MDFADLQAVERPLRGYDPARPEEGLDVTEIQPAFGDDAAQPGTGGLAVEGVVEVTLRKRQVFGETGDAAEREIAA